MGTVPMPETTLHPPGQLKTDTIVAEPVMNEYGALRHLGWIQPFDYLIMALIVLCWLTVLAWKVFGQPTPWNILCCVMIAAVITQLWTISLIFRCSHFVLLIQAYLNTLPEEAARIVMAAYSGQGVKSQQKQQQRRNV
jgi:hypothetical protein